MSMDGLKVCMEVWKPEGAKVGNAQNNDRLIKSMLLQAFQNPKLQSCSKDSWYEAYMTLARLDLEPCKTRGLVWLIPRGTRVQVTLGFKGLVELGLRGGTIANLNAAAIWQDEVERGLFRATNEPPTLEHENRLDIDKTKGLAGAWALANLKDGRRVQIVLDADDLASRRKQAHNGGKSGPWVDYPAAMARKSAIRALFTSGLIPLTDGMVDAVAVEEPDYTVVDAVPVDANDAVRDAMGLSKV